MPAVLYQFNFDIWEDSSLQFARRRKKSANSYDLAKSAMLASCCYTQCFLKRLKKCEDNEKKNNLNVLPETPKSMSDLTKRKLSYKKNFWIFFFCTFRSLSTVDNMILLLLF